MTDGDDPDSDEDSERSDGDTQSIGTGYKVLGENDATAGTPVGVEGRVPNADGYGLATADDARIDGDLTLAALTGAITGGSRVSDLAGSGLSISGGELTATAGTGPATLPPYDTIGDDSAAVTDAIASVFSESAWAEPSYIQGPAHGEGDDAFYGGVLGPTGDVVFVPHQSDYVGLYDPTTNTYESGAFHGQGDYAFAGGALAPTGEVIFAPFGADNVGIYDPGTDTYRSGPSTGQSFFSAVLGPTGEVVFPPKTDGDYVGIYDPFAETYTRGAEVPDSDANATLAPTGEIVIPNFGGDYVGLYDPRTNSYTDIEAEAGNSPLFLGGVTAPTGDVVLAGGDGYVGLVDPVAETYTRGASTDLNQFVDATLSPTGEVVLVPLDPDDPVGIYDPATDDYTNGPTHPQSSPDDDFVFEGGTLVPNGNVVFTPGQSDHVGILNTNAQPSRPWVTAQHPLVNNY